MEHYLAINFTSRIDEVLDKLKQTGKFGAKICIGDTKLS